MTVKDTNHIPKLLNELKGEKERILRKAGAFMEGAIKNKITEGDPAWKPLSPVTIARKKSSKPLKDTGTMRNAVTHKPELEKDRVLVGVFSLSGEEDRVSIAYTHEFGSPKRRIPRRSFLRTSFDEKKEDAAKLIENEVNKTISRYSK